MVKYATMPKFDQLTQYVVEKKPVDMGDYLFIDYEVKTVEAQPKMVEEIREPYVPYVEPKTSEELADEALYDEISKATTVAGLKAALLGKNGIAKVKGKKKE